MIGLAWKVRATVLLSEKGLAFETRCLLRLDIDRALTFLSVDDDWRLRFERVVAIILSLVFSFDLFIA